MIIQGEARQAASSVFHAKMQEVTINVQPRNREVRWGEQRKRQWTGLLRQQFYADSRVSRRFLENHKPHKPFLPFDLGSDLVSMPSMQRSNFACFSLADFHFRFLEINMHCFILICPFLELAGRSPQETLTAEFARRPRRPLQGDQKWPEWTTRFHIFSSFFPSSTFRFEQFCLFVVFVATCWVRR